MGICGSVFKSYSKIINKLKQLMGRNVQATTHHVVLPYPLVVMGEELESELRQKKISDFITWLKKEDENIFSQNQEILTPNKEEDILAFLNLDMQLEKQLTDFIRFWLQDYFNLPFNHSKNAKYALFFNSKLLTKIWNIDEQRSFVNIHEDDIDSLGDLTYVYTVCVVGITYTDIQKQILDRLKRAVCKLPNQKWTIINKEDDNIGKAKDYWGQDFYEKNAATWERYVYPPAIHKAFKKRRKKYRQFNQFRDNMQIDFRVFLEHDTRAQHYNNICILNILNTNRDGGTEDNIAEVFWGNYVYDRNTQHQFKLRIASGCSLTFQRLDNGNVNVYLFPGKTENQEPKIEGYILKRALPPQKLADKKYLLKLWNIFMALTENTSLDGEPNCRQRYTFNKLYYFKKRLIDGNMCSSRFRLFSYRIFEWVMTIGLSGILLSIITCVQQGQTDKHSENRNKTTTNEQRMEQSQKAINP